MPNHVTNVLRITNAPADAVQSIREAIAGTPNEDGTPVYIDFNMLVPMPECLNITSTDTEVARMVYHAINGRDHVPELAKILLGLSDDEEPPNVDCPSDIALEALVRASSEIYFKKNNWPESTLERLLSDDTVQRNIQYVKNMFETGGYPTWYQWTIRHWGTKWGAYGQEEVDEQTIRFETAWSTPLPIWQAMTTRWPGVTFQISYADEDIGVNCGMLEGRIGIVRQLELPKEISDEAFAVDLLFGIPYDEYLRQMYDEWAHEEYDTFEEFVAERTAHVQ